MTVAELQVKRDALVAQIASAKSSLSSGDKSISYQSIDQMQTALSIIDKEIALAGGSSSVRTTLVQHSRG